MFFLLQDKKRKLKEGKRLIKSKKWMLHGQLLSEARAGPEGAGEAGSGNRMLRLSRGKRSDTSEQARFWAAGAPSYGLPGAAC